MNEMSEKMKAGATAKQQLVDPQPEPDPRPELHVVPDKGRNEAVTTRIGSFVTPEEFVGRTLHLQQTTLDAFDDWVDVQRKRRRKKKLSVGEPGNVQECADFAMRLGLEQLGLLSSK